VSGLTAAYGIVARDLLRARRQTGRLLGGVARPLLWLLVVGAGYNAIARVEGVASYRAFVFPGIVTMATLFGGMLTAISTVYDREFGMLRLMLASPAGVPAVLAGRTAAAAAIGAAQGGVVLLFAPLVVTMTAARAAAALGALILAAIASAALGLLIASRLRSVENFAGVINVVLFPLLFLSGALYPVATLPPTLHLLARLNPVTYEVDLMRHAFAQPAEFAPWLDVAVVAAFALAALAVAALVFDPEQRLVDRTTTRAA
jgi:ABC-2 type transport system permease protein